MNPSSLTLSRGFCVAALAALSLFSFGLARPAVAAPFTNGSFESPGGPPATDVVLPQGTSTYVTGWVVNSPSANSTVYESGANRQFTAQDGVWVVSFGHNGTTGATLSQTFDTVAGASYTITYRISRIQGGSSELSAAVEVFNASNSQSLAAQAFAIPAANNTWIAGPSLTFTATSSSTTLQFRETTVGGFDSNWALDNVELATGAPTPTPTPSKTLPKGKLGTTYFGARQHGNVMRFTALITDAAASLKVRVQASTTPGTESSWQDLPNGSAGRMIRDYSAEGVKVFVLNSTNYPLQNGVHFRAVTSAAGYPDSISEADGPFSLATNTPRAGPVVLNNLTGAVPANAPMAFTASVSNDFAASGVTVRLQNSKTPGDETSWADFANSQAGAMTQSAPGQYQKSTTQYPTGETLYFRAIASRPGHIDSLSNILGPYDLKRTVPPVVTITSPTGTAGGSGTRGDPFIISSDATFTFSAKAESPQGTENQEKVTVLRLLLDEATVHRVENQPTASLQLRSSKIGPHRLRAFAITENKTLAAAELHIFIAARQQTGAAASAARRSGGSDAGGPIAKGAFELPPQKIWRTVDHGFWSDPNHWRDEGGNPGVPDLFDLAIINHGINTDGPGTRSIFAVVLSGPAAALSPGPEGKGLNIVETMTIDNPSSIIDLPLTIEAGAVLRVTGDATFPWTGQLINRGKFVVDSKASVQGFQAPAETIRFLLLQNQGQALFGGGGLIELSARSTNIGTFEALKLLGNDGSSLLANDGASIVSGGAGNLLANDGASLISQDGSSIVSGGAGNIVSGGAGNLLANDGASLSFRGVGFGAVRHGSAAEAKAATAGESFTVSGGVIDFGSSPRLASNLQIIGNITIDGGILKGTGVIFGDVTQNGGFIAPGNSAGAIGIDGDFTQGSGGTMNSEVGGPNSAQFDQLVVTGTANVNGKLNVRAINGYAPEPDGTFSPLVYSAGSGSLATSSNAQMTFGPTGLLGTLNAGVPVPPPANLLNIATRLRVEQGENALIGGFILTGTAPKKVIIRALGPSLADRGIAGGLADPTLELFAPDGSTFNNNWRDSQPGEIEATSIAPSDEREAAIVATLQPGVGYTAVVRGAADSTGVGLVEVYDLDSAADSTLANISTRGLVQTGENVMIGGLIIGGDQPAKVLVRAIGPSLGAAGVAGALEDPTLELYTPDGAVISNDNWRETQEAEVLGSTVPPSDEREAAIVATLPPGNYTAIVRGKGDTTGVALVEAYNLQ